MSAGWIQDERQSNQANAQINYSTGKAEKRNAGPAVLGSISMLGLIGGVVYTSVVECRKLYAAGL